MRRMKQILFVAAALVSSVGVANAGGMAGSLGVGTEVQLSGVGGLSVNYDAGKFHLGGFLGVEDLAGDDNTRFDIGGRFFYHIASTAMSDFGIGGSIGIRHQSAPGDADTTDLYLEPGFQIRAFLASNVALSFTGGFSIGAADAENLVIDGQVTGIAGVHYYF